MMFILIIHITAILAVDPQAPPRDQLTEYKTEIDQQVTDLLNILRKNTGITEKVKTTMEATRKFAKWAVTDFQDVLQENEELQKEIVEKIEAFKAKFYQIKSNITTFIVGIDGILAKPDAEDDEIKAKIDEAKELFDANANVLVEIMNDYQETEQKKTSILNNAERVQQSAIDGLWRNDLQDSTVELTTEELIQLFRTEDIPKIKRADLVTSTVAIHGQLLGLSASLANVKGSLDTLAKRAKSLVDESSTLVSTHSGLHARHEELLGKKREVDDAMAPIMVILEAMDKNVKEYLQTLLDCGDVVSIIGEQDEVGADAKSRCVGVLGKSLRIMGQEKAPAVEQVRKVVDTMETLLKRMKDHHDESKGRVDGQNGLSPGGQLRKESEENGMPIMMTILPIMAILVASI